MGVVESAKATNDVYYLVSGDMVKVNEELNNSHGLVSLIAWCHNFFFSWQLEFATTHNKIYTINVFDGREEKHNKICECNSKHNEARETKTLMLYVINVCTYQQNNWRNFQWSSKRNKGINVKFQKIVKTSAKWIEQTLTPTKQ